MKITVVADSHGSAVPLGIARMSLEKSDKIVFLGDFFDHGEKEYSEQKQNFLNVIDFKKQTQDKVVVLIGNHDANYILPDLRKWQPEHAGEIENLILQNLELIDYACLEKKWLFSHAGFSEVWMMNQLGCNEVSEELIELLNTQFHNGIFTNLRFTGLSGYGDEVTQNPLWIRPDSLMKSAVPGVNQVVGHTEVPDEQRIRMHGTDKIIFLDSEAEMRNVYAEIDTDVGNVEVKKLNNVWDYW